MAWEPSLGAFYGPASFIAFVNCMYFLSIFVQLRRHPERQYELKEAAEEQQRLAAGEGEAAPGAPDSLSLSLLSAAALENEHPFGAQLRGAGLTLLLYAALWLCGALAVALYPPLDLVFSFFFGATCLGLSAFLVAHHCVSREDVRLAWLLTCCPGRSAYAAQVSLQPPPHVHARGGGGANGEAPKCAPSSSAESSSCTHRNAASGCKLTNLQAAAAAAAVAAAQGPANAPPPPDNSLTEHSVDNDLQMHVAPLEAPFRAAAGAHPPPPPPPGRHHKNRSKGHRAGRLTVLREYAYDVPTSVEGSVQNGLPKSRGGAAASGEGHARSRRAHLALAHRERQYSAPPQPDSSDATASTLPRSSLRNGGDKGAAGGGRKEALRKPPAAAAAALELESQHKSYGLNLATQNGPVKSGGPEGTPLGADGTIGGGGCGGSSVRTGLWKHETTV